MLEDIHTSNPLEIQECEPCKCLLESRSYLHGVFSEPSQQRAQNANYLCHA